MANMKMFIMSPTMLMLSALMPYDMKTRPIWELSTFIGETWIFWYIECAKGIGTRGHIT